jgi:CheY-like chemotaxis protein
MMTRKILLADDSVTIQKVVELTFAEGDYQVQCVSNGRSAVQKIQEDRPDLLLCDVIMPEMNGYDVAAFVKHNPTFSAIPVILLTGTFEPFDEEKARQSGADTYITKPFDSKMLVDKVEELLKRRVTFDASANETMQVFHSRTEFLLGGQPSPAQKPSPEAPSPSIPPALEEKAGPYGGGEEPFLRRDEPLFAQEPPAQELAPAELRQALPDAGPVIVPVDASTDKVPLVDIGPPDEGPLSDAAFSDIVAPEPLSVAAAEEEIVLSTDDLHEWPANEESARAIEAEPVSVSGAEDWGATQSLSTSAEAVLDVPEDIEATAVAAPILPPLTDSADSDGIVHELTEQQVMVAEAQQTLEHAVSPAEALEPESESLAAQPPEPITGAYEVPAVSAQGQASERPAFQETALVPDDGLEVGLTEVLAAPSEGMGPEALSASLPMAPLMMVETQDTGSYPTPTEQGLDEVRPYAEAAGPEAAPPEGLPEPAAEAAPTEVPPEPPAPPPQVYPDRSQTEVMIREAVNRMLPDLVSQALPGSARAHLAEFLPSLARQHAAEALPAIVGPLVAEGVAGAVNRTVPGAVQEAVGIEVRRAVAEAVPAHVRQATQDMAPGIIREEARGNAADEIERIVKEMAPEIIRQVAWEVIPEMAESLIKRRIQELESEPG